MKITETIKSISDAFIILEQLESEEWRNSNGIGEIEIEFFKEECLKKIKEHQSEAHIFIEGTLKNMNTSRRHSEGISTEIKRLSELQSRYEREYERGKNRIDYLMKTFGIEKLDTELNKLSFRSSASVEITDETLIPAEYIKVKETKFPDKIAIKEAIKAGKTVP